MERVRGNELMLGGLLATITSLLFSYLVLANSTLELDPASVLGSLLSADRLPQSWSAAWWSGLAWCLVNGMLIGPVLYGYLFLRNFDSPPWVRGLFFAGICWLIEEAFLKPLTPEGLFSVRSSNPPLVPWLNLARYAVYGLVMAAVAKPRATNEIRWSERKAAA